ncbi:hypothetical protein T459_35560 [Capsicum annuum]|uniref:Uncharacterized protein n=1 Tax=Capsicum annuum TaxID=4072 RepID=A0A2G2XAU1_CAPAN|nr:hypothetical protein T459_35560 [Capsicum annuum]
MKLYVGRGGLLSHRAGILKRLRNASSQDGADSQASNDGCENTDYEGDFEHVNEIGHSTCFVENHGRAATLLENGKYQASENEGYAGSFEHVNEVGHSARFDENYDRSTHLSKNGKYQAENTGYGGDSERVNEVSSGSKANVLNQHQSTEEQPIAKKVVASRASCTEKVSHGLNQSVNRKRKTDCSFDLRCAMCRKRKKQRSNSYGEINFKATPMPAFYREPDDRSEKTKVTSNP